MPSKVPEKETLMLFQGMRIVLSPIAINIKKEFMLQISQLYKQADVKEKMKPKLKLK